ncbi:MAG: ABC transporter ATP-binding protein, partial [Clostridiaceae bacterium]|nr:ABC transporter ATP-binding protein [Clostridiaceae bacterium]
MSSRLLKTPMVPFPSRAIIPARDLDKPPILE